MKINQKHLVYFENEIILVYFFEIYNSGDIVFYFRDLSNAHRCCVGSYLRLHTRVILPIMKSKPLNEH